MLSLLKYLHYVVVQVCEYQEVIMHTLYMWVSICLIFCMYIFQNIFLLYFEQWHESVMSREGFTPSQQQRMMLCIETRLGLERTGKNMR